MKKLLFCLQTMVLGGVESELITILKKFDRSKYKLSLLILYEQDSELMKKIPSDVEIIDLGINKGYYCGGLSELVKQRIRKGQILDAAALVTKRLVGSPTGANVNISSIAPLEGEYDYAVCYHMHSPIMLRYVADKVKAKRKIAWIHNDFDNTGYKVKKYTKWIDKYDTVAAVSIQLLNEFSALCPKLSHKAMVVNNTVDEDSIRESSLLTADMDPRFSKCGTAKILTVGRYVGQKGYDIAVSAAKILRDRGIEFTWFAIGCGADETKIAELIVQNEVESNFVMLGKKDNPFPYMAECDLYVQPSRHEGYPITMCEAKVLNNVIVCTNFAGAKEIVTDGYDGYVDESFTSQAIADKIEKLLTDNTLMETMKRNASLQATDRSWEHIEALFSEEI